jgi:Protein of unknown function (DUF3088)
MKDQLFVLRPGFDDKGATYFCPYSAQVIGFLTYYPDVRRSVDLVELEFPKPRRPLSDLLDEQHQSAPMLVLAGEPEDVDGVDVGEVNGRKFIEKTIQILRYLATLSGVPLPH